MTPTILHYRTFKLILEYDGTHFCGWQVQKKGMSVQGLLQESLKKITGEKIHVMGSGRTDAGAHALGQVAHFRTHSSYSPEKMKMALNGVLPSTVVVKEVIEVDSDFHAQQDAHSKLYAYLILNDPTPSAFLHRYSWQIIQPLDWDSIHQALEILVGRHDFKSFQSVGTHVRSTVRHIRWVAIQELFRNSDHHSFAKKGLALVEKISGKSSFFASMNSIGHHKLYAILIEADGFLKQMVRNIVGTVVQVGQGRFQPQEVKNILEAKDRRRAGPAAPAKGLFLVEVRY